MWSPGEWSCPASGFDCVTGAPGHQRSRGRLAASRVSTVYRCSYLLRTTQDPGFLVVGFFFLGGGGGLVFVFLLFFFFFFFWSTFGPIVPPPQREQLLSRCCSPMLSRCG